VCFAILGSAIIALIQSPLSMSGILNGNHSTTVASSISSLVRAAA
jgi:hypothetical protein